MDEITAAALEYADELVWEMFSARAYAGLKRLDWLFHRDALERAYFGDFYDE